MVRVYPVLIGDRQATAIEAHLPKTTLLVVTSSIGYIMCGALDVQLLNNKLADRGIIAGRAVGVKTIEQLLDAPLESVTIRANELGITEGTVGREAIRIMLEHE